MPTPEFARGPVSVSCARMLWLEKVQKDSDPMKCLACHEKEPWAQVLRDLT